jgi:hypothetical protein
MSSEGRQPEAVRRWSSERSGVSAWLTWLAGSSATAMASSTVDIQMVGLVAWAAGRTNRIELEIVVHGQFCLAP